MAEKGELADPEGGLMETLGSWNLRMCEWGLGEGNCSQNHSGSLNLGTQEFRSSASRKEEHTFEDKA